MSSQVDIADWTLSYYESNKTICDELITSMLDWSSIPTINRDSLDNLRDGSIVRFVGMVQDVLNPEYFFATYDVKNKVTGNITSKCGFYRDLLHSVDSEELLDDQFGKNKQDVRHPLFCIPMPGMNSWTKSTPIIDASFRGNSSGIKRSHSEDCDMAEVEANSVRKTNKVETERQPNIVPRSFTCEKYFPLPEEVGLACIVKHYGEHEDWLVNTRIQAVGFLSVDPELEVSWQDSDAEDRAMHPPPSLVPRVHALHIRKLPHCNPLLSTTTWLEGLDILTVRSDLLTTLTQLLYGDTLAAEYLLYNLLSSVYARNEGIAIGTLSLNLYNISHVPSYSLQLFKFLQAILPCSVYIPLTIDFLNTSTFVPRKDYDSNRLWSGRLQLADDTHLLIDETGMMEGRLVEPGLRNMAALHSLTLRQTLPYNFTYYNLDFHTNIPTAILSEGKSLIPTNVAVKVKPDPGAAAAMEESFTAASFFMAGQRLDATRIYLTMLRLREFQMDDTDFVGSAWADLRQSDKTLQQDDLHNLLVLSRLISLSEGRNVLTKSEWDRAVKIETYRRARNGCL